MSWAYTQTKNKFNGPTFRELIFGRKNTSIYNLLNLLFFFFFPDFVIKMVRIIFI